MCCDTVIAFKSSDWLNKESAALTQTDAIPGLCVLSYQI